jgi:hypothetical protein
MSASNMCPAKQKAVCFAWKQEFLGAALGYVSRVSVLESDALFIKSTPGKEMCATSSPHAKGTLSETNGPSCAQAHDVT